MAARMPAGLVQRDLIRDTPTEEIKRYRLAAQTALVDIHYPEAVRLERAAYYTAEADRLEASCALALTK